MLSTAYGLTGLTFTLHSGATVAANGAGQTIALIEVGYDPDLQSDLNTFDSTFNVPAPPNFLQWQSQPGIQNATTPQAEEAALGVEWAHAIAPGANILVWDVAADTLPDTVEEAYWAAASTPWGSPVTVVSTSYAYFEVSNESAYDPYLMTPANHAPVTFVAATGDTIPSVYGQAPDTVYPAASPNVVSVGGTAMGTNSNGTWARELAWNYNGVPGSGEAAPLGGGAGISVYEPRPSYQNQLYGDPGRVYPDVSSDADPATGVWEYCTQHAPNPWFNSGGTSVAAPSWAAIFAIADQGFNGNGIGSLSTAQTNTDLYNLFFYLQEDPNVPVSQKPYNVMLPPTDTYYQAFGGQPYELTQTGLGSPNGYYFLNAYVNGIVQVNPPGGAPAVVQSSISTLKAPQVSSPATLLSIAVPPPTTPSTSPPAGPTASVVSSSPSGNGGRYDAQRSVLFVNAPVASVSTLNEHDDNPTPPAPSLLDI